MPRIWALFRDRYQRLQIPLLSLFFAFPLVVGASLYTVPQKEATSKGSFNLSPMLISLRLVGMVIGCERGAALYILLIKSQSNSSLIWDVVFCFSLTSPEIQLLSSLPPHPCPNFSIPNIFSEELPLLTMNFFLLFWRQEGWRGYNVM